MFVNNNNVKQHRKTVKRADSKITQEETVQNFELFQIEGRFSVLCEVGDSEEEEWNLGIIAAYSTDEVQGKKELVVTTDLHRDVCSICTLFLPKARF